MSQAAKKILFVMTRPVSIEPRSGRDKQIKEILLSASQVADVKVVELTPQLQHGAVRAATAVALRVIWGLLRKRPIPLQCALYDSRANLQVVIKAIERERPDVIYFDTVRCSRVIERLGESASRRYCVCDFDDLMSRRMKVNSRLGQSVALGFLLHQVPGWARRLLERAGALIPRYEAWALDSEERSLVKHVNAVGFVSDAEADEFARSLDATARVRIDAIPPPFIRHRLVDESCRFSRFIFIGSDRLLQNRLTIDQLVELWRARKPAAKLYIYGEQTRRYPELANVHVVGSVADLSEVYGDGSVMLAPALVPGGVKTKVMEAIGYGIPVVGNDTLFEGIPGGAQANRFSAEEIERVVLAPEHYLVVLYRDAAMLQRCLMLRASQSSFQKKWQNLLGLI